MSRRLYHTCMITICAKRSSWWMSLYHRDCHHTDYWHISRQMRANVTTLTSVIINTHLFHNGVIKWKHFPRYWSFVWGIPRSPANSLHKGQWRGALMFYLIYTLLNGWVNHRDDGDMRRHRAHYDVTVMLHWDLESQLRRNYNQTQMAQSKKIDNVQNLGQFICEILS